MKIEISESTITKEHLNGETLLPDTVKTPKEIHNWILNLSNNDRISEQVIIHNKLCSWFSVYEVSVNREDIKYVIDVFYNDIWKVNQSCNGNEADKRKLISGLLLNPTILKTNSLSISEFNKDTKETLSRLSLNNDSYVNQNLIIDSKSVLLSNNGICPYIYFKFENRKDKKEKLFFKNNCLIFDSI